MSLDQAVEGGPRLPVAKLRELAVGLLSRSGVRHEDAEIVAACLLDADRRGVYSHGLLRLPSYLAQVDAGEIDLRAEPRLSDASGPAGYVEADRSFGAVSSTLAMRSAIERGYRHGIGAVTVRNGNHFGAAAYYTQIAAANGLIGVTMTNTPAVMTPWGGAERLLGNNPLSIAAPTGDERKPFVLDMALTNVARGRIKLAEEAGEPIPRGWALGPDGRSTTDAAAALDGVLLPFGGYKGSALAMAVEILSAVSSGSALSHELENTGLTGRTAPGSSREMGGVGALHMALDPTRFGADASFPTRVKAMADSVESARAVPEFSSPPAVPGFSEAITATRSEREGVQLHPATARALARLAAELEIEAPAPLSWAEPASVTEGRKP